MPLPMVDATAAAAAAAAAMELGVVEPQPEGAKTGEIMGGTGEGTEITGTGDAVADFTEFDGD